MPFIFAFSQLGDVIRMPCEFAGLKGRYPSFRVSAFFCISLVRFKIP
jgi:hypothetical protein